MAEKKSPAKSRTKAKSAEKNPAVLWTSGRRKTAVARVKMVTDGEGCLVINDKPSSEYFPSEGDQQSLLLPFQITGCHTEGFKISVKVAGGGRQAQLGACMLGLAKALVEHDHQLRPILKKRGLLTRDPRMKERKKYGLKRARKAPQYSKR